MAWWAVLRSRRTYSIFYEQILTRKQILGGSATVVVSPYFYVQEGRTIMIDDDDQVAFKIFVFAIGACLIVFGALGILEFIDY